VRTYTLGNVVVCRFAFLLPTQETQMTDAQFEAFRIGQGLPVGFGVDQQVVTALWGPLGSEGTPLSGGEVSHDGVGAYSIEVAPAARGVYWYQGVATTSGGGAAAATRKMSFAVTG
jgi:hypothetical protein